MATMWIIKILLFLAWLGRRGWGIYNYKVIMSAKTVETGFFIKSSTSISAGLTKAHISMYIANEALTAGSDAAFATIVIEICKHGFYSMF